MQSYLNSTCQNKKKNQVIKTCLELETVGKTLRPFCTYKIHLMLSFNAPAKFSYSSPSSMFDELVINLVPIRYCKCLWKVCWSGHEGQCKRTVPGCGSRASSLERGIPACIHTLPRTRHFLQLLCANKEKLTWSSFCTLTQTRL